jgi:hypothetical protein
MGRTPGKRGVGEGGGVNAPKLRIGSKFRTTVGVGLEAGKPKGCVSEFS